MGLFLAELIAWPIQVYLAGWLGTTLWGWFITPGFGLAVPSIHTMTGLVIFAALFKSHDLNREGDWDQFIEDKGSLLALLVSLLGMGWLWKWLQWGL